ncbi:MAG: toll/interleukin-1 receptor domain-containing protein [Chloroflexi bacterium]|nr:toll/interleukin-1 receptor domain-containing protein [Chloroflexota bacterium]
MIEIPSGRYFISHSYKDSVIRDEMINLLPVDVEPFIFPPIKATPAEFVSNHLIDAILKCNGMIYLNEGQSAKSFWVAFERDYALRANKPVFAYTPSACIIESHEAPPLDLAVFPSYKHHEESQVQTVLEFMRKNRYFDLWIDRERLKIGDMWADKLEEGISDFIKRGGYVVVFWSGVSSQNEWIMKETLSGLQQNRVVVAGMEDASIPDFILNLESAYYVQLVDENGLSLNRVDDIIVRLYWLIFRNQYPELVYE